MKRMDIQALLDFDKNLLLWFNGSESIFMDNLMIVLTSGLTWIPLYLSLLYIIVKNNDTMPQILLVVGCSLLCVCLADGMADLIVKPWVMRPRPSNDPILKYSISVVDNMRGSGYSFFSAHAANTFSLALFFSLLIRSKVLGVTLVLWSLVNCYTRMYLGLHYPSDILAGLAWGAVSGIISYTIYVFVYNKFKFKKKYISSKYTSTGFDNNDIDIPMLVICMTFIYSIFWSIIKNVG